MNKKHQQNNHLDQLQDELTKKEIEDQKRKNMPVSGKSVFELQKLKRQKNGGENKKGTKE